MSQTESAHATNSPSDQRLLSHYLKRLLHAHGGSLSLVHATERAASSLEITGIKQLIIEGTDDATYTIDESGDTVELTGVVPKGTEPPSIAAQFEAQQSIDVLEVEDDVENALRDLGYTNCEDIVEADAVDLTAAANDYLAANTKTRDPEIVVPEPVVTTAEISSLAGNGFTTTPEIARAEPEDLADSATTLTVVQAEELQSYAQDECSFLSEDDVELLQEQAEQQLPSGPDLFRDALSRYTTRTDSGTGSAVITEIAEESETVGDPVALSHDGIDTETLQSDPKSIPLDAQYVSDIGPNATEPVPTGLPLLEETSYSKIPKPDTHPDAGDDALPTNDNGTVIPPAVPVEPRRQLPLDELVAKKLSRGLVPVCIVGPPGSGKNYLCKYLAYRRQQGYRSIDVSQSTMPEDLFGPLTPDEDGTIVPRNGAVKQGLLAGDLIVINEFPAMQSGAATELHRLLNEGTLLVKQHGELIQPHPAARLIITMNPPGERENRASEPMPRPTRGRFRRFEMPYPQSVDDEVRAIDQQVNSGRTVVNKQTLEKIVEFAHRTRDDQHDHWPTLSTRNLVILCEDIEDGVAPKAAVKGTLWGVAEPYQQPADAHGAIDDLV